MADFFARTHWDNDPRAIESYEPIGETLAAHFRLVDGTRTYLVRWDEATATYMIETTE